MPFSDCVQTIFPGPLCDVEGVIVAFQNRRSNNFSGCGPVPHQLGAEAVKHRCYAAVRQAVAVPLCDVEGMIVAFLKLRSNNFSGATL